MATVYQKLLEAYDANDNFLGNIVFYIPRYYPEPSSMGRIQIVNEGVQTANFSTFVQHVPDNDLLTAVGTANIADNTSIFFPRIFKYTGISKLVNPVNGVYITSLSASSQRIVSSGGGTLAQFANIIGTNSSGSGSSRGHAYPVCYTGYADGEYTGAMSIDLEGTNSTTGSMWAAQRLTMFSTAQLDAFNQLMSNSVPTGYNVTYHLVHATGDENNPTTISPDSTFTQMRFYPEENYELKTGTVFYNSSTEPPTFVWNPNTGMMQIGELTGDITVEIIAAGEAYPIPSSGDSGETHPGTGSYDFDSDIPKPHNVPMWDTTQAGFINIYVPTAAGLNRLANYLWAGSFDPDNLRKLFANPMDVILGCHILPVPVPTAANPVNLAVGNVSTGISMAIASTNWIQYDCGSVDVPVYYEAYMAYAPYTKIQIYLPFCGTYELDPDIIVGRTVNVLYNIDVLTGACVVDVSARYEDEEDASIYYQFTGNCAAELPISSGDYKNALQVLQSAAVAGIGIIGGAVGGGALGAAGAAAAGVGAVASAITDMTKPTVAHSGSVSGNAGYLGLGWPMLTIITPRLCKPDKQNEYIGLPIYATAAISDLEGFTVIDSIHFNGFTCTDAELTELEELLNDGVIF